ncbi:hypothetical protein Bb109J_c2492 [Bdellovibrio bacteriovorus]|uniref:hypothetical protein n=1 Tax=Bdellovibrio bacteriovorus TaxID=959 RepID=UPI00130E85A2|nr:hypothetical protein [Bdellovibrio bacteriovorus]BEV69072.1 hypothetical protein Bb109J_c2492 [Bdellovibrio bacteriovorus]
MNELTRKQKTLSDHVNLAAHILSSLATFAFATAAIIRLAEDGRLRFEEEKDRNLWVAR